jgi:SAM-dependent methyltransferase
MFAPDLATGCAGFPPASFQTLSRCEGAHFWFRARNRLLTWAFGRYFANAASFLEIGCGTGFVLGGFRATFPRLSVSGSEIFNEGLSIARQRLRDVSLFQMDARRVPFVEEFDVIGAFDVLEHIEEDEIVLREMYRATRPGGGVLIAVPQHPALWSAADVVAQHRRRYGRGELIAKTEQAGFKVLRTTSFVTALLPIAIVSRGLQRRGADVAMEFDLPRLANLLLETTLDCERLLIRAGMSFRYGLSRLLVARRIE